MFERPKLSRLGDPTRYVFLHTLPSSKASILGKELISVRTGE